MRWPGEREAVAVSPVPVRPFLRRAAALWLPAAVAATVVTGVGYGSVQQVLRSGANDPQIQVAHDAAERLASGVAPSSVANGPLVDLATSLDTTVEVFDVKGQVLASTARLNNAVPRPPTAALTAAQGSDQNVVTWQPRSGVRQAAVIVPFAGPKGAGYVVAARSLRLVEQRENDALAITVLGWLLTLVCVAVAAAIGSRLWPTAPPTGGPSPSKEPPARGAA